MIWTNITHTHTESKQRFPVKIEMGSDNIRGQVHLSSKLSTMVNRCSFRLYKSI